MLTSESYKSDRIIRSEIQARCFLCASPGSPIYSEQSDYLFGAPGHWNIVRCNNARCRLLWLNPKPLADDIGIAYERYYTHESRDDVRVTSPVRRIYESSKNAYLAKRYGYRKLQQESVLKHAWVLFYAFPRRRAGIDESVRLQSAVPEGRLLDVGCGSGDWMNYMATLGWQVEGLDFDSKAVNEARRRGLSVWCSSLEERSYQSGAFDAITLHHVIEHLPDPRETLRECARILKSGGKLTLFTPNHASMGHRLFRKSWRGLEPPRHINIFSPISMQALLESAGFSKYRIFTVNSRYLFEHSIELMYRQRESVPPRKISSFAANILAGVEQVVLPLFPSVGECLAAEVWR